MLSSPIRYCGIVVSRNHGSLPIRKKNMVQAVTGYGRRNYAKSDKDPCKHVAQSEGKKVEKWPKDDPPPPAWRCECPSEPQPPNYDPYRIKVPDIMVPPLPPSNAKWNGVALTTTPSGGQESGSHGYQQHPHHVQAEPEAKEEETDNTFLGMLKGFFGKGKKTEDSGQGSGNTMMECPHCAAGDYFGYPTYCNQANASSEPASELFYAPTVQRDYWMQHTESKVQDVKESKLGYHGKIKFKYAFHEPWKPLDRISLLEQAEREEAGQGDDPPLTAVSDKQLSKSE